MSAHYLIRYRQTGDDALREQKRPEHIAFRKGLGPALNLAGPLLDDAGTPVGSVIILTAATRATAEAIAARDPFVAAGLLHIESVEPMRIAAMSPPA
jgi:uncharacterized protein YciI